VLTVAAALMFPLAQVPATAATEDFPADGSWLVPAGVSIVQVFVSGGTGGSNSAGGSASGGKGGAVTAGLSVSEGERIYVGLGTDGQDDTISSAAVAAPSAFKIGSGGAYTYPGGTGGGGGGASAIAVDNVIVVIAGGGGGAGGWKAGGLFSESDSPPPGNGGDAGLLAGGKGSGAAIPLPNGQGGAGGSEGNGFSASTLNRTSDGLGGGESESVSGFNTGGGGGGAGYYGGREGDGGGNDLDEQAGGGGGGGASYTSSTRIPSTNYESHALSSASPSGRIDYINITTTSLASANTSVAYTASLAASFGVSGTPDQWSVSPTLPTGITLDPNSGVVSGTASTASTGTYTFTATELSGGKLVARSSVSLTFSVVDPLTPTFDTPVATVDGYTVNVTNYDASFTWTPSVNAGSVTAGTVTGSTLPLTITGLSAGASATTTVDTSRSGYANGTATVTGSSASEPVQVPLPPAPTLIVDVVPAPVHYGVVSHNGKCPVGWSVGGWEQWAGTQVCLLTSTYDGVSNTWIPGDYRTVMTQVLAWNAVPQALRTVSDINLQSR
jgi:hypothetical protein